MVKKSGDKTVEWAPEKKWNPFNSYKLLAQVYRWRQIRRGCAIPQPSLVTIDPINQCNQKCIWCNADFILKKNSNMISHKLLLEIADYLSEWQGSKSWEKGVESICIAGGGEPLLNPYIGDFIDRCVSRGIEVGVVTNGVCIDRFIENLSKCTWVGASIDAAFPSTMEKLKKVDYFDKIINNIRELVKYSRDNKSMLASSPQGYGVSYKWLLHPENIHEVYEAAKIAKEVGCKNFHMRPASTPWNKIRTDTAGEIAFQNDLIREFNVQTEMARSLEDDHFGVFGISHKFDDNFCKRNNFHSCHAVFMTAVIMPGTDTNYDSFNLGLCCDRRGDDNLFLGRNITNVRDISNLWGSERHWDIYSKIDLDTCPRCTYQPHNQIYEQVILNDSMTYKFI